MEVHVKAAAVPMLVALAFGAGACKRPAADDDGSAAQGATPADGAACDVSTDEKALELFVRATRHGAANDRDCATAVLAIDGVLVGRSLTGSDCRHTHVIFRCGVHGLAEASAVVLPAMGWTTADTAERERLAMLWVREVECATGGFRCGEVLSAPLPEFARTGRAFRRPTAESGPDGSVRVSMWYRVSNGTANSTAELHEFRFAPDGSMMRTELDAFCPDCEIGRILIGAVQSDGGAGRLQGTSFQAALVTKRPAIEACYRDAVNRDTVAKGDLAFAVTVAGAGAVAVEVETNSDSLEASGVTTCVADVLRTLDFTANPPDGGDLRFLVPISFQIQ